MLHQQLHERWKVGDDKTKQTGPRKPRGLGVGNRWVMGLGRLHEHKYSYFKCFVPRAVVNNVFAHNSNAEEGMLQEAKAELKQAVVLLVDISGFTRLSDRFQGLGQEGIDSLTSTINKMFSTIITHVEDWGGDIVKFAGDAVIVIWECTEATMQENVVKGTNCALELEREHGIFKVHVPDANTLEFADQLARHFATAVAPDVDISGAVGGSQEDLENLEIRRRLRAVPWLKMLSDTDIATLAEKSHLSRFKEGAVIMRQGSPGDSMQIVHSGVVTIYEKKAEGANGDQHGDASLGELDELEDFGDEIASREEGSVMGEMSLMTGERRTATVVAATHCVMINVNRSALQPLLQSQPQLAQELADLMKDRLKGVPFTSGVTLRLHQSLSCGPFWFAHCGGQSLDRHNGARREFLVIGKALEEAAVALEDAVTGTVVVGASGYEHIKDVYDTEKTKNEHYKINGYKPGHLPVIPPKEEPPVPPDQAKNWTTLKMYCHEGARDLQDIAPFAADVRKMTVMFVRLDVELTSHPNPEDVRQTHKALLAIQSAIYKRKGTLRQFLQDDKGLLAICIIGMPPFSPNDRDPVRAVLAAIEMHAKIKDMQIEPHIGITTGTAYSGFVGSSSRREMCAMGSMVNMSARLMCKANGQILVDKDTYQESSHMIDFEKQPPMKVKGRDAPLEVFKVIGQLPEKDFHSRVRAQVLATLKTKSLPEVVQNYFSEVMHSQECSKSLIDSICGNLLEYRHISKHPDGSIVAEHDLSGLENGLTRMQALARGYFDNRLMIHHQMLAKVVCFLSHSRLFSVNLAKHVYTNCFPNFAQDFDEGLEQLLVVGVIQAASVNEIRDILTPKVGRCQDCQTWNWQTAEMQVSLHAQLLQFKGKGSSGLQNVLSHSRGEEGEQEKLAEREFKKFVDTNKVYCIPVPGLVETTVKSLLKTYQRIWHLLVAEFYEKVLDPKHQTSCLILAHHWGASADHNQPEQETVIKAADSLHLAGQAAINNYAYLPAIEMLQKACRILDRIPMQPDIANKKLELLAEMAPHTLLVYGNGSTESMTAYHGLHRLIPKREDLDKRAVRVLAGICVNLYGRQLYEAGAKMAERIIRSGKLTEDPMQLEVGWASLVPALFFTGEFEVMFIYQEKILEAHLHYIANAQKPPVVNGVVTTIVALVQWPTGLLISGDVPLAQEKAEMVLRFATECNHPPTLGYVLAILSNDYFPYIGDLQMVEDCAQKAYQLANRHGLGHIKAMASRAMKWASNVHSHFRLLEAIKNDEDISFSMPAGGELDVGMLSDDEALPSSTTKEQTKVDGTHRLDSILLLQSLALKSEWEIVLTRVAINLTAARRCGSFWQCELLRLNCAALIAVWDEGEEEDEEQRQAWLERVRTGFAKCIEIAENRGLCLHNLLAAVDWLRFEIASCQHEGVAFNSSLLLALSHATAAIKQIRGGELLLSVKLGENLVNRYEQIVHEAADMQRRKSLSEMPAEAMDNANHKVSWELKAEGVDRRMSGDLTASSLLGLFDGDVAGSLLEMLGYQPSECGQQLNGLIESADGAAPTLTQIGSAFQREKQSSQDTMKLVLTDEQKSVERDIRRLMNLPEVAASLRAADDWGFDPFQLNEVTGSKPLQVLAYHLMEQHGVMQALRLDSARFAIFLAEIEKGMPSSNPYHNSVHVAHVVQNMHVCITQGGLGEYMGMVEILAALLAAVVHDFEHMGLNNDILVKIGHDWALAYNDRAPNENHHSSAAFRLLQRNDCNFMRPLHRSVQAHVRKLVIDMVLATDMGEHHRIVSLLKTDLLNRIQTIQDEKCVGNGAAGGVQADLVNRPASTSLFPDHGGSEKRLDTVGTSLMLCGAIKVCDIGHSYADVAVHIRWSELLEEELYKQGDLEMSLGLPLSYLMDRGKAGVTKSQVGFFDFVVKPLAVAWSQCFPAFGKVLLKRLEVNLQHWQQFPRTESGATAITQSSK